MNGFNIKCILVTQSSRFLVPMWMSGSCVGLCFSSTNSFSLIGYVKEGSKVSVFFF